MFYLLEPEVAGHFGKNGIVDISVRPPIVKRFHYEMDGWLGDDLLETIACYIVTDRMKRTITEHARTGYDFGSVEVTTSEQFEELYPNREVPDFFWLKVSGKAGIDDIGMSPEHRLVMSDKVLSAVSEYVQLSNCDVSEFRG